MNDYSSLDLHIIKKEICNLASIKESQDFIMSEEVSFNPLEIENKAYETKEALNLLKEGNVVTFDGIYNVNELLDKADKNICLEGIELRNVLVFHNHCRRIKKLFEKFNQELLIRDYTDSITVYDSVFDKVNDCIDNAGMVKDDATPELKRINAELDRLEKELYSKAYSFIDKHSGSLQEPTVYVRNDRLTFLFKNSDKNKFQGYQYGTSSSGLATYVEPAIFVELNNKKIELIGDRADEIDRLLRELSYLVSSTSEAYRYNFDSLMRLNVIFAKANYGMKYDGIIPEFSKEKYFDFTDVCHPLIDQQKVVCNSYRLYSPYQGIVISGSNTGGKTVSLKTIGLSIVMSYLGIPIICEKATIPFYDNIFVDIDDNQSISDSLSTFSAHITNINNILNRATASSLILIDELISGTDPKEAQAISLSIMEKIKELNSVFIITTHFDDIKNYSYDDEKIMLSSVGFDMETLKPTYHYLEDSVGASNAIEIASRYFDDQSIIDKARFFLKKNQNDKDELMEKLSKQIEETEHEKALVIEKEESLTKAKEEYDRKLDEFIKEKDELRNKYIKDLNDYLDEMKEKAQEKLDSIKDKKDSHVVRQIEELKDEPEPAVEKKEIAVGDNVRIKDNEQIGKVMEIRGNKVSVNMRGITIKANLEDLTYMPKVEQKKTYTPKKRYERVPMELNLVGERVEEALIMAESYLDRANAASMSSVKIIHGIGTGALRNAIREKLKKLSYIKSFRDGDYYDGGSAVTIVEFN